MKYYRDGNNLVSEFNGTYVYIIYDNVWWNQSIIPKSYNSIVQNKYLIDEQTAELMIESILLRTL